jgi:hypothetical protein
LGISGLRHIGEVLHLDEHLWQFGAECFGVFVKELTQAVRTAHDARWIHHDFKSFVREVLETNRPPFRLFKENAAVTAPETTSDTSFLL